MTTMPTYLGRGPVRYVRSLTGVGPGLQRARNMAVADGPGVLR